MRRMLAPLTVVVSLLAAAAGADEVEELINTLKPSPLDYAAWPGDLLNAVGDLKDSPVAQARVYEKAYELGIKQAKGYPAAIKAAHGLLEACIRLPSISPVSVRYKRLCKPWCRQLG